MMPILRSEESAFFHCLSLADGCSGGCLLMKHTRAGWSAQCPGAFSAEFSTQKVCTRSRLQRQSHFYVFLRILTHKNLLIEVI
jgi:hypothetical protein